jgi:hypothetical protein
MSPASSITGGSEGGTLAGVEGKIQTNVNQTKPVNQRR